MILDIRVILQNRSVKMGKYVQFIIEVKQLIKSLLASLSTTQASRKLVKSLFLFLSCLILCAQY